MNISQARREMFMVLQEVWANTVWPVSIYGSATPILKFQGRDSTEPPSPVVPYSHIYRRSALGEQAGFSDGQVAPYRDSGTLWILNFGPQSSPTGLEMAEFQATIALNAYRQPNRGNCIWFRSARIVDVGLVDGLEQINVLVDYDYNGKR